MENEVLPRQDLDGIPLAKCKNDGSTILLCPECKSSNVHVLAMITHTRPDYWERVKKQTGYRCQLDYEIRMKGNCGHTWSVYLHQCQAMQETRVNVTTHFVAGRKTA